MFSHLFYLNSADTKTLKILAGILINKTRLLALAVLLIVTGCGGDDVSSFNDSEIPSPVGQEIEGETVTPSDPGAPPATEQELEILPTVTVGSRQFSDPNVLITLRGNAVAADNASISSTLWTQIGEPRVQILNPSQPESVILVPDLDEETQLQFRFVAQDSEGRLNSATTSVVVRPTPAFTRIVGSRRTRCGDIHCALK